MFVLRAWYQNGWGTGVKEELVSTYVTQVTLSKSSRTNKIWLTTF